MPKTPAEKDLELAKHLIRLGTGRELVRLAAWLRAIEATSETIDDPEAPPPWEMARQALAGERAPVVGSRAR